MSETIVGKKEGGSLPEVEPGSYLLIEPFAASAKPSSTGEERTTWGHPDNAPGCAE